MVKKKPKKPPYTPEELSVLARGILNRWTTGGREFDEHKCADLIAEFVAAGYKASMAENRGIRAYQYKCGHGAMLDFLKRDKHWNERKPKECPAFAKRISLDMIVPGQDDDITTLAETVRDPNCPDPSDRTMEAERNRDVASALAWLPEEQRYLVQRVLIDGETQQGVADSLGITRDKVRALLGNAKEFLRRYLSEYATEYANTRYPRVKK